jgi:hypothetical protein
MPDRTPRNDTLEAPPAPEWGPCCVCGATDEQPCPGCPNAHVHSAAAAVNAGPGLGYIQEHGFTRAAHENNHRGCYVCSNCVNLQHDGSPVLAR